MRKQFKYLGRAVKEIRTRQNLTQTEIAAKFKVHAQYISNCERGLNGLPDRILRKLPASQYEITTLKRAMTKDGLEETQRKLDRIFKK